MVKLSFDIGNEDPLNSTALEKLKKDSRQLDAAIAAALEKNSLGDSRFRALNTVSTIVAKVPAFANSTLLDSVAKIAGRDPDYNVQRQALSSTTTIIEKRPDLAHSALLDFVVYSAAKNRALLYPALETISTIVTKRPDLADPALTTFVTQMGVTTPGNIGREQAQKTLTTILEKCPDLAATALTTAISYAKDTDPGTRWCSQQIVKTITEKYPGTMPMPPERQNQGLIRSLLKLLK